MFDLTLGFIIRRIKFGDFDLRNSPRNSPKNSQRNLNGPMTIVRRQRKSARLCDSSISSLKTLEDVAREVYRKNLQKFTKEVYRSLPKNLDPTFVD